MKITYLFAAISFACALFFWVQNASAGARDRIIDPETSYLEQRQAYLDNYQNKNAQYEDEQKVVLQNFNSRHREYLEIDMPGPQLYFPHDD